MSEFVFPTDTKGFTVCREIVLDMIKLFKITEVEAVGRINRHWKHTKITGEQNIVYHENTTFWAKDIFYGHDSKWWKNEEQAKPLPYP